MVSPWAVLYNEDYAMWLCASRGGKAAIADERKKTTESAEYLYTREAFSISRKELHRLLICGVKAPSREAPSGRELPTKSGEGERAT